MADGAGPPSLPDRQHRLVQGVGAAIAIPLRDARWSTYRPPSTGGGGRFASTTARWGHADDAGMTASSGLQGGCMSDGGSGEKKCAGPHQDARNS